jgi:hypothetical protein
MRWAEVEVLLAANSVDLLTQAASDLDDGSMSPVAYAALVDATMANASGTELSREFPPRERDYLRKATNASSAPTRPPMAGARPAGSTQQPQSGVNARQVAAGAAAGAALWNLFSD